VKTALGYRITPQNVRLQNFEQYFSICWIKAFNFLFARRVLWYSKCAKKAFEAAGRSTRSSIQLRRGTP